MLITEPYRQLNAQLHKDREDYGIGGHKYARQVQDLARQTGANTILDYGCGKRTLERALGFQIENYDPAVPGCEASPSPADLVVCFPAETVVGGSTMYIDKVGVGDAVGGSGGIEQSVTKTFHHRYSGDMVTLKVATVPDLEMTAKHPVLVSQVRRVHRKNNLSHAKSAYEYVVEGTRWKHAKDVQKGDWVCVPRLAGSQTPVLRFKAHGNSKRLVERIVDEETAWLLGLYVAEGFTSYPTGLGGRLTLCLGSSEEDLAHQAVAAFSKIGVHASIYRPKNNRGTLLVHASKVGLCRALDDWCGKGAANKVVPEAIKFAPEAIIRAFITGLVDGDGCLRSSPQPKGQAAYDYFSVTTVSKRLGYGLLELLHKIGVHAYFPNPDKRQSGTIEGREVAMQPAYTVLWSKRAWEGKANKDGKVPYGRSRFIANKVYLPVKGIANRSVSDFAVYNIETEDHTYGVPYTVHNCTDVLEHIEPACLEAVLDDLKRVTRDIIVLTVATRPAKKTLADGTNAHKIIEPSRWWLPKIMARFELMNFAGSEAEFFAILKSVRIMQ